MNKERAEQYQSAYLADYGFERVMVRYRRQFLLERLAKYRPELVVEIGCGSELLYEAWHKQGDRADSWVIVEPASQFAEIARESSLPKLHLIEDFFEKSLARIEAILSRAPDMVICSGLLHEVPSTADLLTAIRQVMGAGTLLHVNVPNAESMHRRLARAMGLITNTKTLSARNVSLLQHRVYDMESLKAEISTAGLCAVEQGGYLVKPFTHGQMEHIIPELDDDILDGLYRLGKEDPEWASEIFIEASLQ